MPVCFVNVCLLLLFIVCFLPCCSFWANKDVLYNVTNYVPISACRHFQCFKLLSQLWFDTGDDKVQYTWLAFRRWCWWSEYVGDTEWRITTGLWRRLAWRSVTWHFHFQSGGVALVAVCDVTRLVESTPVRVAVRWWRHRDVVLRHVGRALLTRHVTHNVARVFSCIRLHLHVSFVATQTLEFHQNVSRDCTQRCI